MLRTLFSFQLAYTLRRPLLYLIACVFLYFSYRFASNIDPSQTVLFAMGGAWHNAPYIVARFLAEISILGFLITVVIVAPAVYKDFRHDTYSFFFTAPISRLNYLGGRFLGAMAGQAVLYSGLLVGLIVGCIGLPPENIGPFRILAYVQPVFVILIPNLLFLGVVMFGFASLTRSMITTYIVAILALFVYAFAVQGASTSQYPTLLALVDPFGMVALKATTEFWTIAEKNTQLIPLEGLLLYNRLLWLVVSGVFFGYTVHKFSGSTKSVSKKGRTPKKASPMQYDLEPLGRINTSFSFLDNIRLSSLMAWRDFKSVAFHLAFLVLTFVAVAETINNFTDHVGVHGNAVHPHTLFFLPIAAENLQDLLWGITIFFAGVLVWKERDRSIHEFSGALPVPNSVFLTSKVGALLLLQTMYVGMGALGGILVQLSMGFSEIDLFTYLKGLGGIHLVGYWHLAVVAVVIQVLSPNKYVGFVLTGGYLIIRQLMAAQGVDGLLNPGDVPGYVFSDMNGFGHFLPPIVWYRVYGLFFDGLLLLLGTLIWVRAFRNRIWRPFQWAQSRWNNSHALALGILLVGFISSGFVIFHNDHVLNQYRASDYSLQLLTRYEREYKSLEAAPQPAIRHVDLRADLFPETRDAHLSGTYIIENTHQVPITDVHLFLYPARVNRIEMLEPAVPHTRIKADREMGYVHFRLTSPLHSGDTTRILFDYHIQTPGFSTTQPKSDLAHNGMYIDNFRKGLYFPLVGYTGQNEVPDNNLRQKQGLPLKVSRSVDDKAGRYSSDHQWITFDASVTTDTDHVAIAPGELVSTQFKAGRREFHFKNTVKMIDGGITLLSGKYKVHKEKIDDRSIEIYHHPTHAYNIDRMAQAIKATLAYGETHYSSYPYGAVRIVEVPDYGNIRGTARSLPGLFTWTETGGFLSNLELPGVMDNVFNTTTHEMAHQWWAHQVQPAQVAGGGVLVESLAQWVRLAVMEDVKGSAYVQQFLERERLRYLRGRSFDDHEVSMMHAEASYLLYNKGSMVMYALADYIGRDSVEMALKSLVDLFAYSEERYPTTQDLLESFRRVTPDSLQYVLTDLFETITLYDLKAREASYRALPGGLYKVDLIFEAHKLRADSMGQETEISIGDYIDIGVFDDTGNTLYMKKHWVDQSDSHLTIEVSGAPAMASVDPFYKLIDRTIQDNRIIVKSMD